MPPVDQGRCGERECPGLGLEHSTLSSPVCCGAPSRAAVAPSQLEWVDPASEQPAEGVVRLVVDESIEAFLPLSEMVDAAKERARA